MRSIRSAGTERRTAFRLNPILLVRVMCEIAWRARICVRRKFCLSDRAELRGGAWPSCAFVKWSASSLSCPLSTPVQRPGRRDKGRPGTCSSMFINKPRRSCPTILPSQYVWKRTQVIVLLAEKNCSECHSWLLHGYSIIHCIVPIS